VTDGEQTVAPGRKYRTRAALFVAGMVLIVSAPVVRVVVEGRGEERASEAALRAGDVAGATVHSRRAAMAYVPFAPHVSRAYQRLRTIAIDAEMRGDHDAALFAWRAIRSASMGSSHVLPTAVRERRVADAAIARVQATARAASLTAHHANLPDLARRYAENLEADSVPARGHIAVLIGGLIALVGGGIWWVKRALSADGRIDVSKATWAAALAAMGAAGWIVGLLVV
jgi:hypothetical protein